MRISVLIPAYNEEQNIEETIEGVKELTRSTTGSEHLELEIIVIDDGSRDNTHARAVKSGVETIKLTKNIGKGGALEHGLKKASGDIIVFLDADLKRSSSEASKLIKPIMTGEADVVIGSFKPSKTPGGLGLVKALAFYGVKLLAGCEVRSSLSGQRAFNRQVLDDLGPIPGGFSLEVGMLIDLLRKGYRVVEVPVEMCHEATGRNLKGFLHRGRQFIHILRVLISKIRRDDNCLNIFIL